MVRDVGEGRSVSGWRWDVALSFAGAQRPYVEQVATKLKALGVRCFYDAHEQLGLWGDYLVEQLPVIYAEQAGAVVVFVSAEYLDRDWTRVEGLSALNRAVRERRAYVLPALFDDTPLPGLLSDMAAIDLRTRTPGEFARLIVDKLVLLGIVQEPGPGADAARFEPHDSSGVDVLPPPVATLRLPHPPCDDCSRTLNERAGRGLRKSLGILAAAFDTPHPTAKDFDRGPGSYRNTLLKLLENDPSRALCLYFSYDSRVPSDAYASVFGRDEERLVGLASRDDLTVLTVVLRLAGRLRLPRAIAVTRSRLSGVLGRERDADLVTAHLRGWRDVKLLDAELLTGVLRSYVAHSPLERDPSTWSSFFALLPPELLPPVFEVHHFLGRGAEAVRLADTPARRQLALDCCLRSSRTSDVEAGIALAGEMHSAMLQALQDRAAELLFTAAQYDEALPYYRAAGRAHQVSMCYERLGRFGEALESCPADVPDRLAGLVERCLPEVSGFADRRAFPEAIQSVRTLLEHLGRAAEATDAVTRLRNEMDRRRIALLKAGRRHFGGLVRDAAPDNQASVYKDWSQFEEAAGELSEAARWAEESGDLYRAHEFYRAAGQFGHAERVLRDDNSPEGRTIRARSLEAGGDLVAAAFLDEGAGDFEKAFALFAASGKPADAARCLLSWRGDDAIEDPQLADCLRQAGDVEQLVRLCIRACESNRPATRAAGELRLLRAEGLLPPELEDDVAAALDVWESARRRPFEARAEAWAEKARAATDERFAGIWGLDLGTTTCAVAIYDTRTGRAAPCPWKGNLQFASTLSLDARGDELVGLAGEEIIGEKVQGHISGSKRRMGARTVYRIRGRTYRPEEVAARLIRHARRVVEDYLAAQVLERLGELARAELGEVRDDWLAWAEEHLDLRLSRDRAVLTVPAYFSNNQNHATRDACVIAGVEAVRLIHEPTAACMGITRQRDLAGQVVVVDLGGGTLDLSLLEVGDGLFDVQKVAGDNKYGGRDFDEAVYQALVAKLERQGVRVPQASRPARRLAVAAEYLKVSLSTRNDADYTLLGFAGNDNVRLELNQAELAQVLATQLAVLREVCAKFRAGLADRPEHLVLVGGPMLASPVRSLVESVFNPRQTVFVDPRTAVATGAAIQAAVLDRKITERVLLDVTPFPLGIRAFDGDGDGRESFSVVVDGNTHIPIHRTKEYSTREDNQTAITIEIFNGSLDTAAKIGQFTMKGIPPAPRGKPKIEVTFDIDPSCVLRVTARDTGTGISQSVTINDTTLLSPTERHAMAERYEQQREQERRRAERDDLQSQLNTLIGDATRDDGGTSFSEFEELLAAFRPPATPLGAESQNALAEMFNPAVRAELEMELRAVESMLRDVVGKTREYLERNTSEEFPDLTEGQHLASELGRLLSERREPLEWLRRRKSLLASISATDLDPVDQFRGRHDAGDYAGALRAFGVLRPGNGSDLERLLHCVAEAGDADRYRRVLDDGRELLPTVLSDPANPGIFLRHTMQAVARIFSTTADGRRRVGTGFLISDILVVTNRTWLADPNDAGALLHPARVDVALGTGTHAVDRIHPSESPRINLALLQLAEPVTRLPLRLGYPKLVRLGDHVWALSELPPQPEDPPAGDVGSARPTGWALRRGVVEEFKSFPEYRLQLIKAGFGLPAECSGGPLLNDLGEVVAILAIRDQPGTADNTAVSAEAVFALSVDALGPLFATAGFQRFGTDGGLS